MFKFERTDKIITILKKCKYATVDFLVDELHYSPATIRRDLTYLEGLGLVKKAYGGVSIVESAQPYIIREHENIEKKTKICRAAANLIKDGDAVFIDGTTTTYFMGDFLEDKNDIIVTTSNLKLASNLGERNINCYVTGGKVLDTHLLEGSLAIDAINKMFFDICFFSVGSVSEEGYIFAAERLATIIKTTMKHSKKSVCLCDSSKVGLSKFFSFATLNDVDCFICDKKLNSELTDKFPNTEFIYVK